MPQTSVPATMTLGSAGQLADEYSARAGDAIAGTNEEASASIPFGCLAYRFSDEGVKLPASLANVKAAAGVLVHEDLFDTTQLTDVTVHTWLQSAIKPGVTGSFLRKARILVIPENTGTEASGVFVRIGGAGQLGSFRTTGVVSETVVLTPLARWLSTPTAGAPAVLEIDLTNVDLATAS
jgi:hypothetical protein